MDDHEMALGGNSVIRWLDQAQGRPMRVEFEPAVPSTGRARNDGW